ncbi:MAG TPA: response regulator [Kofleriaceae bacterium]
MKKRILFVDDDPDILEIIEGLLRDERERWDMVFAPGALRGLEELAAGTFHVVVTDLQMPDIDGAALLEIVQRSYPSTRRVMLTSETRKVELGRALRVAHQIVTKPCTAAVLREAIARGLEDP